MLSKILIVFGEYINCPFNRSSYTKYDQERMIYSFNIQLFNLTIKVRLVTLEEDLSPWNKISRLRIEEK